ncbi:MAG: small conductance mechanosensitive channel [Planctomycetota bacterium]|jgi:small conductance mechanosensitive channel
MLIALRTLIQNGVDSGPESGAEGSNSNIPASSFMDTVNDYVTDPEKLMADAIPIVIKVALAAAIFIIGRMVARIVSKMVRKILTKKADETLAQFLSSIVFMLLMVMVVIAALDQLGVETTGFAAILAAAGFAVGMALQGSLGNFAAGVMLMLFRPIKVGDFIEAGGTSGVVLEIGIFSTIMKTGDNKRIIVPNNNVTGGNITNYSAHDTRRVDLVFGIGYDDDLKQAKELLHTIVNEHPLILKDPEVTIAVSELADSSVNFVCRPWVKSSDYWGVLFDLTETVKLRFDAAGISIPFPQTDVHVHQDAS